MSDESESTDREKLKSDKMAAREIEIKIRIITSSIDFWEKHIKRGINEDLTRDALKKIIEEKQKLEEYKKLYPEFFI